MVSSKYRITEPHPSVPSSHYVHAGRGGAGNVAHVDPRSITAGADASGPASRTALNTTYAANPNPYYATGRGGAGNMHHTQERPIFSFDEELDRQRKMMQHQAPVYHVGRGGAGNFANEYSRRMSERSEVSDASSTTDRSVRGSMEGAWNRLRGTLSKHQ